MYIGNDGGIYRSTTAAASGLPTDPCNTSASPMSWTNLNNGYAATQFYYGVLPSQPAPPFGGAQDNGMSRARFAGGATWSMLVGGDGGAVAVDPNNTNISTPKTRPPP